MQKEIEGPKFLHAFLAQTPIDFGSDDNDDDNDDDDNDTDDDTDDANGRH